MQIALYASESKPEATTTEITWPELVAKLTAHELRESKSGPAWAPHQLSVPYRKAENVTAITAAVFDLDDLWESDLVAVDQAIDKRGLAAILHTTHKHAPPDKCRARLVLPVSRPVLPAEWARFRAAVIADLGLKPDAATKDGARLYFLPSRPANSPEPISGSTEGKPLDVDAYLRAGAPVPAAAPTPAPVSLPTDLRGLAKHLRNVRPEKRELVRKILAGEPLADQGGRDHTLNEACSLAVWQLPDDTPLEAVLELLRDSIRATPGAESPEHWEREAKDMLLRAKGRRDETRRRQQEFNEATLQFARESSAKSDVAATEGGETEDDGAPYTDEQIERWAREQGCTTAKEFEKRWVIQKDTAFFVFVNGRYLNPITARELPVALFRDLSRARVDLFTPKGGRVPIKTLLERYCTVARYLEASLSLQRSHYDAATDTFYEACCPLRPIAPVEHPDIDKWLRLLGNEEQERLLDWLATLSRLDRQTCAIYLHLPPSAGKTLLMKGLARLWTTGSPSEFDRVNGGFNSSLTRCPLIVADESIQAHPGVTAEIRRLIGQTSGVLARKYLPDASLQGAVRLIIAANNPNLLDSNEDLTSLDVSAVAQRFLYIHTTDELAGEHLRALGGAAVVNDWVDKDMLAQHVTWLAQNRTVEPGDRFLVEGVSSALHDQLSIGSGDTSAIYEFIVRYLQDASPPLPANLIIPGSGRVLVRSEAFCQKTAWEKYVPSARMLTMKKIGASLSKLSEDRWKLQIDDAQRTFHLLSIQRLLAWAQTTGVDIDALRARIAPSHPMVDSTAARRYTASTTTVA